MYDTQVDEIILRDNRSQFGTHILIQRPLKLNPSTPTYIINGHTLFCLNLLSDQKSIAQKLLCCFQPTSKNHKYLEEGARSALYEDVKFSMPHDLMKYEQEKQMNPYQTKL
jgi:hypothetical protein